MPTKKILIFSVILVATMVQAAWEDTGVPANTAQGRPAQIQRPAPRVAPSRPAPATPRSAPRTPPSGTYYQAPPQPQSGTFQTQPQPPQYVQADYAPRGGSGRGLTPPNLYSPLLDADTEPLGWFSIMHAVAADVDSSPKDLDVFEIDSRYNLVQWRNALGGDIGIDLRLRSVIFGGSAGFTHMPTALLELPLDFNWTWRYLNAFSLEIGARPGIYADAESLGDGFGVPFRGVLYYAVDPELSWMLGMEVRPGWDLVVMPLVGLGWEPSNFFHLILACPTSKASLRLGPVSLYGTFAWRNTTYGMSGKKGEPDDLTFEDLLLGGGVTVAFTENFRLGLEAGRLFERTLLAAGDSREDKLGLDDTFYWRLTLGGAF